MRKVEIDGEIYNIRFNHYKNYWDITRASTNESIVTCDNEHEVNEALRELEKGELS